MGRISDHFDSAYRDFVVDGVASSGLYEPIKGDLRSLGETIEGALDDSIAPYLTEAQESADEAVVAQQATASAAAVQNTLLATPAALPYEVSGIALTAAGSGGTANGGPYALGVTGGPLGFAGTYRLTGGGAVDPAGITITNRGLAVSSTAPTITFPSGGVTGATATATTSVIGVGKTFYGLMSDGLNLGLWGNNAGVLATAPFGGAQLLMPRSALFYSAFDIAATRYAYGKRIAGCFIDSNLLPGWIVSEDGYLYAKPAIRVGTASNGLTWAQAADGFWQVQLGSVQGQLPLGSDGELIDTTGLRYYQGQQVVFAQTDANGAAALIVTIDGKVYAPKLQSTAVALGEAGDSAGYLYNTMLVSGLSQIIQTAKASGAVSQVTASGNNSKLAVSYDGSKLLYSSDRSGADRQYWQPIPANGNEYPAIAYSDFTLIGDSRTVYYGPTFAALYPSRTTKNEGFSGQWSGPIAGRFGAVAVTCSVTGGSIPASGNVGVNTLTPNLFQQAASATAIHGTLAGIPGTLIYNTSTGASFTRDTAGTALSVSGAQTFVPDSGTVQGSSSASGAAKLSLLQSNTAIIAPGYNDLALAYIYATQSYSQSVTLANIAAIVAALKPLVPHYAVLGVYMGEGILVNGAGGLSAGQSSLGLAPSQTAAAQMYDGITALNAALAAAYPNNFIDMQAALVAGGYGETATINSIGSRTILNPTMLPDGTHPSTATPLGLVASTIKSFLDAKGW